MKKPEKRWIVLAAVIALAIPAVVSIRAALPKPYYIAGGSMEPTLATHSRILVQRRAFADIAEVKRGDIIVHTSVDKSTGSRSDFVRRVVALPNDKVRLSGTAFSINGRALPHTLVRRVGKVAVYEETNGGAKYLVQYGDGSGSAPPFSTTVPAGRVFCLGDNRDNSYDNRYTGAVPFEAVVGKRVP